MKKVILLMSMAIGCHSFIYAQKGFEIGLNGLVQNTWLINQTDFDEGANLDVARTIFPAFSIQGSYGFSNRHGVRLGFLASDQGQNYVTGREFTELPNAKYYTYLNYHYLQVFYRYNGSLELNNSAFIAEIGPQFGFLKSAKSTAVIGNPLLGYAVTPEFDSREFFNERDIQAHLGVGILARFTKSIHMNAMFQLNYSLSDIEVADKKPKDRASTANGVAAVSLGLFYLIGGNPLAR